MSSSALVGSAIVLISLIAVVVWVAVWISKTGDPGLSFALVVFRAASVLAIFRVACLWYLFPGIWPGMSMLFLTLLFVGFYPEGIFLSPSLLVTPGIPGWKIGGTVVFSLMLTFTSILLVTMLAGIIKLIKRFKTKPTVVDAEHS